MVDERVFTVSGSKAVRAERVTLAGAGLLERQHLQEWVREHSHILGEDVLVVTEDGRFVDRDKGSPSLGRGRSARQGAAHL